MTCDLIRDRLELYVLGQLDAAEQAEVESHVSECPDCQVALRSLETTVALMPEALVQATGDEAPNPDLLATLHGEIRKRQATPAVVSARQGWLRHWPRWSPARLAAVVAIAILAVSIGWGFRLNQALSEERELRQQVAQLVDQQEIVLEIVDGADTERRFLRPPPGDGSTSYGKVFTRPEFTDVVIMAGRLPPEPDGFGYHVWLTSRGVVELAGTLDVNDDGFGLLVIEAPEAGPSYEAALVTLQRFGETSPGGSIVISWPG